MKKLILEINVKITGFETVDGKLIKISMIEFEAESNCECFKGRSVSTSVDTQKYLESGDMALSARYMLEGVDCKGLPCRIFIENNGYDLSHCTPTIVTDSEALSFLETADLCSEVTPVQSGVIVRIYKI